MSLSEYGKIICVGRKTIVNNLHRVQLNRVCSAFERCGFTSGEQKSRFAFSAAVCEMQARKC